MGAVVMAYREKDVSTMPLRFTLFAFDDGWASPRRDARPRVRPCRVVLGVRVIARPSSRFFGCRRGPLQTWGAAGPLARGRVCGTPRGSVPRYAPDRTRSQ